mmetsp:Transcript_12063/g.24503  ORF Transcript_12063/g.24503 Transcript_12063/m.24503 type:complete len:275 (+) Transcript_12063:1086-1910(+)
MSTIHPGLGVRDELLLLLAHAAEIVLGRCDKQRLESCHDLNISGLLRSPRKLVLRRAILRQRGSLVLVRPCRSIPKVLLLSIIKVVRLGASRVVDTHGSATVAEAHVGGVQAERTLNFALHVNGGEGNGQVAEEPLLGPDGALVVVEASPRSRVDLHSVKEHDLDVVPDLLQARGREVSHRRTEGNVESLLPERGRPGNRPSVVLVLLEPYGHARLDKFVRFFLVVVVVIPPSHPPLGAAPLLFGASRAINCVASPGRHVPSPDDGDEETTRTN